MSDLPSLFKIILKGYIMDMMPIEKTISHLFFNIQLSDIEPAASHIIIGTIQMLYVGDQYEEL